MTIDCALAVTEISVAMALATVDLPRHKKPTLPLGSYVAHSALWSLSFAYPVPVNWFHALPLL